jgi:hypothetical protein
MVPLGLLRQLQPGETAMDIHHSDYIDLSSAVENPIKAWCARLIRWNENRRLNNAERAHREIVRNLDARIQHDIGETDLRPPPPASALAVQSAAPLTVEAMLNRSI